MQYYKITIENYYYQEAWGDRSGVQIRIEDSDRQRGAWVTEAELARELESMHTMAQLIAKDLKILHNYKDTDRSKDGLTYYVYDWYSIGD